MKSLWNKNFIIVVLGQLISLFGNAILRFILPFYLLEQTNSPQLFGICTALSFLPMILLTPVGGILADRLPKQQIMVILDFSTAALMCFYLMLFEHISLMILLIPTLMLLYGIQGTYQPTVQASIPVLIANPDHLPTANAIINQISALANLLGPILGSLLYQAFGLKQIIWIGILCFLFSAIMELFLQIPHIKATPKDSILQTVHSDFQESISFLKYQNPFLPKSILIVCLFNFIFSSMLIVGIPVLIQQTFHLQAISYGIAQGVQAFGGLAGGLFAAIFAKKIRVQHCAYFLLFCGVLCIPIGLSLLFQLSITFSYLLLLLSTFGMLACATLFTVQMLSFVQAQTPRHLTGKVIAFMLSLSMCAQPAGQALYGFLFEQYAAWCILLIVAFLSILTSIYAKRIFQAI